jgi:hypothetical protein
MDTKAILKQIDDEIARLKQVKALLGKTGSIPVVSAAAKQVKPLKKRKISAAGRARIAEAQRKRWAAQKKALK